METAMTADAGRAAVERYFMEMGEIYRSGGGTEETSYYSAFEVLAKNHRDNPEFVESVTRDAKHTRL
jgi:hypothetical protein